MCSMKFLRNKIFTLERKRCISGVCLLSTCFVFFPPLHSHDLIVNSKPKVKVHWCYLINVGSEFEIVENGVPFGVCSWEGTSQCVSEFGSRHALFRPLYLVRSLT